MPDREAIERGIDFESRVAKVLDGNLVSGSGNKWYNQSDVVAHNMRISCKSTSRRTWVVTRSNLKEAIDIAQGTGEIPVLAIQEPEDSEELIVMRLSDFANTLAGEATSIPAHSDSKGMAKRSIIDTPLLLRD